MFADVRGPISPFRLDRLVMRAIGAMGFVVIGSWLSVATVRLAVRDASHVPGVWMALASYVNRGTVYPDLYDGVNYGGTRYMPLFFLTHAALARLTRDYLVSGHLLTILCTFAVLGTMVLAMRRIGCAPSISVGLASLVLLTPTGMLATTTIRGDILAVALQLGAILSVPRGANDTKRSVGAAMLCILALFSKSSALWAVLAITTWLLVRRYWRQLVWFVGSFIGLGLVGILVLQGISDGLFVTNIVNFTFLGTDAQRGGAAALGTTLGLLREFAPVTWALMGLTLVSFVLAGRARVIEVHHLAFAFAVLITVVVISDPGTGHNQLIDIVALTTVLVADSWNRLRSQWPAGDGIAAMVAIMIAWVGVSTFMLDMRPAVTAVARGVQDRSGIEDVRHALPRMTHVLSEDPAVSVILGQVPTVLDPWMLLRLGQRNPSWLEDLAVRIEAQEFDAILLLYSLSDPEAKDWYERQHFGSRVIDAVERSYRWVKEIDGLHVYAPAAQLGLGSLATGAPSDVLAGSVRRWTKILWVSTHGSHRVRVHPYQTVHRSDPPWT
jgi:hypothetical protein